MTIAVDWDVKPQPNQEHFCNFHQINSMFKNILSRIALYLLTDRLTWSLHFTNKNLLRNHMLEFTLLLTFKNYKLFAIRKNLLLNNKIMIIRMNFERQYLHTCMTYQCFHGSVNFS